MTTTSQYLAIENNLSRYQTMTADQPSVKTATAYYQANIGKVTSIQGLLGNYKLLSYALQAYGLGDQINSKALIQKVLEEGVTSSSALANTLPNPNWKKFAEAFNFSATGASAPSSSQSVATTTSDYVEQQLEGDEGQTDPGVQLALYFQRVAPTVTNGYGILGDQNLLEVVQTIFGLASTSTPSQIDAEAAAVSKLVPTSDLQDPKKLQQLVERFTANYDAKYGPASGNSGSLAVTSGNTPTATDAASSILTGVINSNGSDLASTNTSNLISSNLLAGLMGLSLGG